MITVPLSVCLKLLNSIRRIGPKEKCGFFGIKKGVLTEIVPVKNSSKEFYRFEIKFLDRMMGLAKLCLRGKLDEIGFYHTHSNGSGKLSKEDEATLFAIRSLLFLIVTPMNLNFYKVKTRSNVRVIETADWTFGISKEKF